MSANFKITEEEANQFILDCDFGCYSDLLLKKMKKAGYITDTAPERKNPGKSGGCIGCIHCGACHNCHGQSRYVDKRQMTEKQAIQMINDCKLSGFVLAMLRQNGYISESELEQQSSTKEKPMAENYCPSCKKYKTCTSEYREDSGICDAYKPMTEKAIFERDEDALDVASDCIDPECKLPNHDELVRNFMKNVRSKGYIRKSELAQLVDEAEEVIESCSKGCVPINITPIELDKIWKAFHLLKKEVERLGGKI